jgi:hypothetical protein
MPRIDHARIAIPPGAEGACRRLDGDLRDPVPGGDVPEIRRFHAADPLVNGRAFMAGSNM